MRKLLEAITTGSALSILGYKNQPEKKIVPQGRVTGWGAKPVNDWPEGKILHHVDGREATVVYRKDLGFKVARFNNSGAWIHIYSDQFKENAMEGKELEFQEAISLKEILVVESKTEEGKWFNGQGHGVHGFEATCSVPRLFVSGKSVSRSTGTVTAVHRGRTECLCLLKDNIATHRKQYDDALANFHDEAVKGIQNHVALEHFLGTGGTVESVAS